MATIWTDPSDINTDWRKDYTTGRHTYGAAVGTVVRILFGDYVRYGGTANLAIVTTIWGDPSDSVTNWT